MRLIWDATGETMYPVLPGSDGVTSGSVVMIREITKRLAARGHEVHVVANDVSEDCKLDGVNYWPTSYHPRGAEILILTHQLGFRFDYQYNRLVLAHTGCSPELGPGGEWAAQIDAWPVFSRTHRDLLLKHNPSIDPERVHVTGLGVDAERHLINGVQLAFFDEKYRHQPVKCKGRLLYANDPQRGLWHLLDIFNLIKKEVPDATLHVAYDFNSNFERERWAHTQNAVQLLECRKRMEADPAITNLGALSSAEILREQHECDLHVYPSDPPGVGTQTHGLLQLELAAAGVPLVLSDVEAFPEIFGGTAQILPVVGKYRPDLGRRISAEDYAAVAIELITDRTKWWEASHASRELAKEHTWDKVVDAWEEMIK